MRTIDKYSLLGPLGEGGFGEVHLAFDPDLEREVAIKICRRFEPEARNRFLLEGKIAASLRHPAIVTIFHVGEAEMGPFLVMEYLEGEDLPSWLLGKPAPSIGERLAALQAIADGLSHAHARDIVHRDIKPSNVRRLTGGEIKILDFGIAKALHTSTQVTRAGTVLGSSPYIAPEIWRGKPASPASDIFAFGVLAYELIAMERPFVAEDTHALAHRILQQDPAALRSLVPECPPALEQLVEGCLAKSPANRSSSLTRVARQLEAISSTLDGSTTDSTEDVTMVIHRPALAGASESTSTLPSETSSDGARRLPGRSGFQPLYILSIAALATLGTGLWWWAPRDMSLSKTIAEPSAGAPASPVLRSAGARWVERIEAAVSSTWQLQLHPASAGSPARSPMGRAHFELGELLSFELRSERAAHLLFFFITENGDITLIYPSPDGKGMALPANAFLSLPDPRDRIDLIADEPGDDYCLVLAGPFRNDLPHGSSDSLLTQYAFLDGEENPANRFVTWIEKIASEGDWALAVLELRLGSEDG